MRGHRDGGAGSNSSDPAVPATRLTRFSAAGSEYLAVATQLLQDIRRDHPHAGVWEAADLQWWWRSLRRTDAVSQSFWADTGGHAVGAAIRTDWNGTVAVDVIAHPALDATNVNELWSAAISLVAEERSVESMVDVTDRVAESHLTSAGLVDTGGRGISAWMDSPRSPKIALLPAGYRLLDRAASDDGVHHMADRNGPDVEKRLNETSLYRTELDLLVVDQSGAPAAYGLFWFDPVTAIGFVEPMGTLEDHRRKGLASHLLGTGLERLLMCGATRIKINYEVGNDPASALYLGMGFRPVTTTAMYVTPG